MSKFNKLYSPIRAEQLKALRGYNYISLVRGAKKIPTCSGIYIWRYWPTVKGLEFEHLLELFERLQHEFPKSAEHLKNSRVTAEIIRTPFGGSGEEKLFGKDRGHEKILKLVTSIKDSTEGRIVLATLLDCLLAQAPPIYIGKADNIKSRLLQHFDGKTDFAKRLSNTSIPFEDLYISYIEDGVTVSDDKITATFEEILQRITNPPLVTRYG